MMITAMRTPLCRARQPHLRGSVRVQAGRAVILGTGMAGLVTAQRLTKHFDEVICIERDKDPASDADAAGAPHDPMAQGSDHHAAESSKPSPFKHMTSRRPGVPQYNHVHVLLGRGARILDDSFGPAFREEITREGGRLVDWYNEIVIAVPPGHTFYGQNEAAASNHPISFYSASRGLIEDTARRLLLCNPKVTMTYGNSVAGFVFETLSNVGGAGDTAGDKRSDWSVTGVKLQGGDRLSADLVVDTTGRGSRAVEWLKEVGCEVPAARVVDGCVGYVSRLYKLSAEAEGKLEGKEMVVVMSIYPYNQVVVMQRVEGGDWLVAMGGFGPESMPPKDDSLLMQWVEEKLWWPRIAELMQGAQPLAPSTKFFGVKNVHHRFDAIVLPERLIMLGDSICAFNPVYGQGMTVSAIEAELLDEIITKRMGMAAAAAGAAAAGAGAAASAPPALPPADPLLGLPNEHARAAAGAVAEAWILAAGFDSTYPWATSTEEKSWLQRVQLGYIKVVLQLCATDPEVHEAMSLVWNMLEPSSILLTPRIAAKVAAYMVGQSLSNLVGLVTNGNRNGSGHARGKKTAAAGAGAATAAASGADGTRR